MSPQAYLMGFPQTMDKITIWNILVKTELFPFVDHSFINYQITNLLFLIMIRLQPSGKGDFEEDKAKAQNENKLALQATIQNVIFFGIACGFIRSCKF